MNITTTKDWDSTTTISLIAIFITLPSAIIALFTIKTELARRRQICEGTPFPFVYSPVTGIYVDRN